MLDARNITVCSKRQYVTLVKPRLVGLGVGGPMMDLENLGWAQNHRSGSTCLPLTCPQKEQGVVLSRKSILHVFPHLSGVSLWALLTSMATAKKILWKRKSLLNYPSLEVIRLLWKPMPFADFRVSYIPSTFQVGFCFSVSVCLYLHTLALTFLLLSFNCVWAVALS